MGKFWMQMDSMMYWMRDGIRPGAMPASLIRPLVADPLAVGACQDCCRLNYAAKRILSELLDVMDMALAGSGLSVTAPIGDQFRVCRLRRAGFRSRACR